MTEYERRDVLKATGLTVAAGIAATAGAVTADETAGEENADGTTASGESDGWVSVRGNAGNTGYVPTATGPESPVTAAWKYDHTGQFAVVDGIVYLVADDGRVHAIDTTDGSLEWKNGITTEDHAEPAEAAGSPAVASDTVYVSGKRGNPDLTALDAATGELRWQVDDLGHETNLTPIVADERVFLVADKVLYCLDARTGERRWSFEPEPVTFDGQERGDRLQRNAVAVADGAVFAVSNGRLFARDVETGDERWTVEVRDPAAGTFTGHPIAAAGLVAVVRADAVTVFGTETGDERTTIPNHSLDALTDDRVYTVSEDETRDGDERTVIAGYDRATGDTVWERSAGATSIGTAVVDDGSVYVGFENASEETGVAAFDRANGDRGWRVDTDARPRQVAVVGETVYASGDNLHAIRSEAEDGDGESPEDGANETDDEGDESLEGGGNATENEGEGASEDATSEADDDTDGTPGFTAGAGVAGGALSLEWLRRRAVTDEREE